MFSAAPNAARAIGFPHRFGGLVEDGRAARVRGAAGALRMSLAEARRHGDQRKPRVERGKEQEKW
jgi:hypothetical protein